VKIYHNLNRYRGMAVAVCQTSARCLPPDPFLHKVASLPRTVIQVEHHSSSSWTRLCPVPKAASAHPFLCAEICGSSIAFSFLYGCSPDLNRVPRIPECASMSAPIAPPPLSCSLSGTFLRSYAQRFCTLAWRLFGSCLSISLPLAVPAHLCK
jgi:hypothetical protein